MRLMETFQKLENHFPRPEIQISGGFVSEQDRWFPDKSPGQNNPLLFPSGQLARAMCGARLQTDLVQSCQRLGGCGFPRNSPNQQRHHHVLQRRKFGQKIVNLPDETDLLITEVGQLPISEP